MSDDQNADQSIKRRRRWSESEKLSILKDAEETSYSEAARQHQIATALIFQWRKQLRAIEPIDADSFEPEAELISALGRNGDKLDNIDQLCAKLLADLQVGKLPVYNGAIAYSSLTKAFTSVQAQRLELMDRLGNLAIDHAQSFKVGNIDFDVEREAEQICYALVKRRVDERRAASTNNSDVVNRSV